MRRNEKYTIFGHTGFLGKNIINFLKKDKIEYFLPQRKKLKFSHNLGHIIYCIGVYNVLDEPIKSIDASLKILSSIILENKFTSFTLISSTRLYLNSKKTNESDKICINPNNKDYFFNSLRLTAENFCLSRIIKTGKYRLYNIASNKRYSLDFISRIIQKQTKCKIKYINQKAIYNEPVINIDRIKKEFNFRSNNNFKESLIKIIISKKSKRN